MPETVTAVTTATTDKIATADGQGAHSNAHPDEQFRADFLGKLDEQETAKESAAAPPRERARDAKGKFAEAGGSTDSAAGAGAGEAEGAGTAATGADEDPNADGTEDPASADSASGATDSTGDEGAGEGEGEGSDEATEAAFEEKFEEQFTAAMAKHATLDVKALLKDLPAEVRPVVAQKLKAMDAGFTRAMQELRADQKASLADKAELRFQREDPAAFVTALLMANPEIADKVNATLTEMEGSENARKYHGVIVEQSRANALKAVETETTEAQRKADRAVEVERLGRAAGKAAGLPDALWSGLEAALALHITQHGDISDADIKALAKAHGEPYRKLVAEQARATKRDASKQYVQDKVRDRDTAGLRVKPNSGHAPGAPAKPMPKNDDEFKRQFIERSA